MAKRRLEGEDDDDVDFVKKHSLDSDEEDDSTSKKYEILEEEDIEGQEEATIEYDGDIKITPFNMKEELEEGHFDKEGNYYLNKEDDVRDGWLDNIDWVRVKAQEAPLKNLGDSDSDSNDAFNEMEHYKQMLDLMKPGETVLKAIKRLGGKNSSANASSRWTKKRKQDKETKAEGTTSSSSSSSSASSGSGGGETTSDDDPQKMLLLTELADGLLHRGKMEIYNATYEKLNHMLRLSTVGKGGCRVNAPIDDDDCLDMFGEEFDEKINKDPKPATSSTSNGNSHVGEPEKSATDTTASSSGTAMTSDELMWEFKWENNDEAKIYGPHTTSEMNGWVEDGYFTNGVWVRRRDQPEAPFYSSKRVDFELYL